jgi:hypothetical protein
MASDASADRPERGRRRRRRASRHHIVAADGRTAKPSARLAVTWPASRTERTSQRRAPRPARRNVRVALQRCAPCGGSRPRSCARAPRSRSRAVGLTRTGWPTGSRVLSLGSVPAELAHEPDRVPRAVAARDPYVRRDDAGAVFGLLNSAMIWPPWSSRKTHCQSAWDRKVRTWRPADAGGSTSRSPLATEPLGHGPELVPDERTSRRDPARPDDRH